jgi:hypothetical protein
MNMNDEELKLPRQDCTAASANVRSGAAQTTQDLLWQFRMGAPSLQRWGRDSFSQGGLAIPIAHPHK